MDKVSVYLGMLLGALFLAVIVEIIIALITRLRKRGKTNKPQPFFNRERIVRVLFVTVIVFVGNALTR